MKKITLIGALVAVFALTACGGLGGGDDPANNETDGIAKIKIRFHVDSKSSEGIAYKRLVDAFNVEFSNEIKVTPSFVARTAGDSAYERQLSTDMVEGSLPDIITFDAPNCAAYASKGYLYDFTNELSDAEKNIYYTLNTYNGKIYGIPIQESSAGFYYNKNLFSQAGIDVSGVTVDNPWTYDQFKEVCSKLSKLNDITPVDMRMDATKDETATYLLYPFIYASGGSFVDSTGLTAKGYFNSDGSKRGFRFLKDIVTSGYTNYGIGATDFFTGKVGMYLSSGWTISDFNDYKSTFPNRDAWGLLPYPKDVTSASANGSWSFAIGNNARKDKTPVVKLLKYLTNKNSSKAITDATGMIPANKEVETNYAANSAEDVLYQQLQKTSVARPTTVGYPQFSSAFSQVISGLREGDLSALVDDKANTLQNELNKIK